MSASVGTTSNNLSPVLQNIINSKTDNKQISSQTPVQPVQLKPQPQADTYQKQVDSKKQFLASIAIFTGVSILLNLLLNKPIKTSQLPTPKIVNKGALSGLWEDISSAMKLSDMSLCDDLNTLLNKVLKNLQEPQNIFERGGKPIRTILLYGPPGTGKTTFARAIAKEFPNSRFATLDITNLGSKYMTESEKNIQAAVNEICEQAQKNPETKFFVFIDEIDSVMMIDESSAKKYSNNVLNEFKRCFTERLGKHDNIITIGATNLPIDTQKAITTDGKKLDGAMLDRFQEKIYVGYPNKEQLRDTFVANYKNKSMVCDELKNPENKELLAICEFLANEEHKVSFRTLQTLFNNAAVSGDTKQKVSVQDIFNVIKSKMSELHITDEQLTQLADKLGLKK